MMMKLKFHERQKSSKLVPTMYSDSELSFQSSFACAVFSPPWIGLAKLGQPRDWIKSGHVMWCAKFDFLRAAGPPSLCQTPTTVPSCTHNSSSKRLLATFLWLQNHNDLASEVKRGSQAHVETFLGRWMDVTHDQGDSLKKLVTQPLRSNLRDFRAPQMYCFDSNFSF